MYSPISQRALVAVSSICKQEAFKQYSIDHTFTGAQRERKRERTLELANGRK
jgi:hypothetical protein